MRSFFIIAAFALAACNPSNDGIVTNTNPVSQSPPRTGTDCGIASNTLADEKVLFGAETAYNVAADAYVRAIPIAATLPARKVAQPFLVDAYAKLKLARTAYNIGDGCGLIKLAEETRFFAAQAKAQLPN